MPLPTAVPILLAPMVTPFDASDRVDHDAIARNVAAWLRTPLSGLVVGSATGDELFLSEAELLEVVATAKQALGGERFLAGGIDSPSVAQTLRRAEAYAKAGVELLRLRFPRRPAAVVPYFEAVLPRCPVPVLLMHQTNPDDFGTGHPAATPNPGGFGRAGRPAAAAEVIGHVASMDNVFGYNADHDARFEAQVRWHVPADRRFLFPNGSLALIGTLVGADGLSTAIANVLPAALMEVLELGLAGRFTEARPLQERVARVDAAMLPYGPAGVRAAMNLLGMDGTRPRAPTPPVPADAVEGLARVMRAAGFLEG